jgi:hypothetical protein
MELAYVIGPYRAPIEFEVLTNIENARKAAAAGWRRGLAVICPHLNTAHMGGVVPDETILAGDLVMVRKCTVIILVNRWTQSRGSLDEVALALTLLGLRFLWYDPEADDLYNMPNNIVADALRKADA